MKFIIEPEVFEDDIENLTSCLKQKGITYHFVKQDSIYVYLKNYPNKCFCYGSLEFIRKIKELNNPNLITSCTIENYDYRIYSKHFAAYSRIEFLFNHNPQTVKANNIKDFLDTPHFLRPAVGYKPNGFTGGVYDLKDLEYIQGCFNRNDEILVCGKRHIDNEYRIIVSNNQYVTGCRYKTFCKETNKLGFDPDSLVPNHVLGYIEFYLKNLYWYPDDIYVMDLAEVDTICDVTCRPSKKIQLLEINALSTSGFYDCDCNKIVDEIIKIYEK